MAMSVSLLLRQDLGRNKTLWLLFLYQRQLLSGVRFLDEVLHNAWKWTIQRYPWQEAFDSWSVAFEDLFQKTTLYLLPIVQRAPEESVICGQFWEHLKTSVSYISCFLCSFWINALEIKTEEIISQVPILSALIDEVKCGHNCGPE